MNITERKVLQEIRDKAKHESADIPDMLFKMAFDDLMMAADRLDAMIARYDMPESAA